jgi:ribosomal-protein-alanine N-acetyltransferase
VRSRVCYSRVVRPPDISTPRLTLRTLLAREIDALVRGDWAAASEMADVLFTAGWPTHHPEALGGLSIHLMRLSADPAQTPWRVRAVIENSSSLIVGSVNLKGPPDAQGEVEIGWGISADRRQRGYAFEAAGAVIDWIAGQGNAVAVTALIAPDNTPSQRLARKLGMLETGELRRQLPLWVRRVT